MEEHRASGRYLRTERELRQTPLAEVSSATKIPLRTLQCLEEGSWGSLPPPVFLRGFVRSYARHVRLRVEEACQRFDTTVARIHAAQKVADTRAVGDAAAEVGGRRRFGLALFVKCHYYNGCTVFSDQAGLSFPPSVRGFSSGRSAPPHSPRPSGAPRGESRPWVVNA